MEIFVNDVRLAFTDLRKRGLPPKDKPDEPGKYGCQGILDENSPAHIAVRDAMIAVAKAKWPDNWQNIIRSLPKDKKCLRKGDENLDQKGNIRNGFEGKLYLVAKNAEAVPLIAPIAKKPDGSWNLLPPESGKPFAGCYANLKVDIYASNKFGNAIYATLMAVQFVRDGDSFGGGVVASPDGFGDVAGAVEEFSSMGAGSFGEDVTGSSMGDLGL